MMKINAIVPVYNEEKTVANVVDVLLETDLFDRVICVSDGSSDRSVEILESYGDQITLIANEENRGKGYAMAIGLEEADGDIVLFIDADLRGLTTELVGRVLEPVLSGEYEAVLAPMEYQVLSLSEARMGHNVCGNRVYYREDLLPLVEDMKDKGFGIEIFLNKKLPHIKTTVVKLDGVNHLYKSHKGWPADRVITELVREGYQLVNEYLLAKRVEYYEKIEAEWPSLVASLPLQHPEAKRNQKPFKGAN